MQSIFIDAWAWIAMADASDQWHLVAAVEGERLRRGGVRFVTTNLALYEAYTNLARWASAELAMSLRDEVRRGRAAPGGLVVAYVDDELEEAAWTIFGAYRGRGFSFEDCVAFALMRREGIATAFTGDDHFRQMGFVTVPAAAHPEQRGAGT
jgi:predicted nucleic acid-binding protein